MRPHIPTSRTASSERAAARWALRALFVLVFALAWWLRFGGDADDDFETNVVDTARWFVGR